MSLDPHVEELISKALDQRNQAINEQERLLGIVGLIAHAVTTEEGPVIAEVRTLVNEAMRREVFPPGYKGS